LVVLNLIKDFNCAGNRLRFRCFFKISTVSNYMADIIVNRPSFLNAANAAMDGEPRPSNELNDDNFENLVVMTRKTFRRRRGDQSTDGM
jgi:hypothetical protein